MTLESHFVHRCLVCGELTVVRDRLYLGTPLHAIRRPDFTLHVHCGPVLLSALVYALTDRVLDAENRKPTAALRRLELTEREYDVLRGICDAKTNDQIARDLGLKEKTVKNYVADLFNKLAVDNRTQAAIFALRRGIVLFPSDIEGD